MKQYNFLAFDLGATSGRSVLGRFVNGKFEISELTRFSNQIVELHGKYYWNLFGLYEALKAALVVCAQKGVTLDSIGIDTWGVDVVPLGEDGTILGMPRAYRDPYTEGAPERYFQKISREEVYRRTGIQIMNFNTLYQLYAGIEEAYVPLKASKHLLFMPDALAYMLTGEKICEYTIASTSQMLNPYTCEWDRQLLETAGMSKSVLTKPVQPGTLIGTLTDTIARETGVGPVNVVAVAGHDTASAVVAVPASDRHFVYLSSGTWSLMGIEVEKPIITDESYEKNFTNEGGVAGTVRFLKNICGMWILEQCRKEWERAGKNYSYSELTDMAMSAVPFDMLINPDDPMFANPPSMLEALSAYCRNTGQLSPTSDAQIVRCIFESLALRYREVFEMLEKMAPFALSCLHVIGGGSKNRLLNQFTANAIGKKVIAGPSEATAVGNVMLQAMGAGIVGSLKELRQLVRESIEVEEYLPQDEEIWGQAYRKFQTIKI